MLKRSHLGLMVCSLGIACVGRADVIDQITLNTTPLIGRVAGPFAINFQLNDGSGVGDGNNTVILSNFDFGTGGSAVGAPTLFGGVTGSLSSQVVLTDSSFLNYFTQTFQPGDTLTFTLDTTTKVDTGFVPDGFSFAILDNTGSELPTTDPLGAFLELNIDSSNPVPVTFPTDTTQSPIAGGGPIRISAPTATPQPVSAAPEPSSVPLLATALGALYLLRRSRSARAARIN